MEPTIKTIDKLAQTLSELQPLKLEYQQRLDKKIRLEFNYNSNHIEGNTLTYGETELLLIFDKTTGNHELREYEEMKSHDVAFELIKEWAADKEKPLSEMVIKNLHEILLVRPFWKEAQTHDGQPTRRLIEVGNYKKYSNSVRLQNGEMFHYASPEETPIQMGELIQWYRSEEKKGELHPVALAALLHYKFVRIHPFDDGNGRISRLLMNYVLLRHNLPPVIIKSTDKKKYLFALNKADVGDIDAFVNYIAEQMALSLELSIRAAKGESIEEMNDWEKELSLFKQQKKTQIKFSQELSNKVKNEIYYPFIQKLIDKLVLFDEMFSEKSYHFKVTGAYYDDINRPDDIKRQGLSFWEHNSIQDTISFQLKYTDLRNTKALNAYNIHVDLHFNLHSYVIKLPKHQLEVQRNYGHTISEEVTNELISQTAKIFLNYVQFNQPK